MCYTSNLQTKAATENSYPLAAYLDKGIFATVNTDNMSVSCTTLQKEYHLLQQQFGFSTESLQALACAAADATFLPQEDKEDLKSRIVNDFAAWLQG
jgi:adenosine deaminase